MRFAVNLFSISYVKQSGVGQLLQDSEPSRFSRCVEKICFFLGSYMEKQISNINVKNVVEATSTDGCETTRLARPDRYRIYPSTLTSWNVAF